MTDRLYRDSLLGQLERPAVEWLADDGAFPESRADARAESANWPHDDRIADFVRGDFAVPPQPPSPPAYVITTPSTVSMSFNIMPDRAVSEVLDCREYRVWPGYVEADFDRSYKSQMEASPSHLIFLTMQAHAQKLAYLAIAQLLDASHRIGGKELFKMWWTSCFCNIPCMVRAERGLTQALWRIKGVRG